MSHSYKKKPYFGYCCYTSNKWNKRRDAKDIRHRAKQILRGTDDYDSMVLPEKQDEVNERWDYPDDGRHYLSLHYIIHESNYPFYKWMGK